MYAEVPAVSVRVIRDTQPWQLCCREGEEVVFCLNGSWVSGVVDECWLSGPPERGLAPLYQCSADTEGANTRGDTGLIYHNTDQFIQKRLELCFGIGQDVLFSSKRAVGLTNRRRDPWLRGKVSLVDVVKEEFYAAYQVTFMENNKKRICYILKDDDEHITSIDSAIRERLMDAIDDGCSYEHFRYLIESSGMDITPFCDHVVNHAVRCASYDALLWLEKDEGMNLLGICDADGNGLLHQVVQSPYAKRFMQTASDRIKAGERSRCIEFNCFHIVSRNSLFDQRNNEGQLWLHHVILSPDRRILDLALSPIEGIVWELFDWLAEQLWFGEFNAIFMIARDLKDATRQHEMTSMTWIR